MNGRLTPAALLTGDDVARAQALVRAIAHALGAHVRARDGALARDPADVGAVTDAALTDGLPGIAVFFAELDRLEAWPGAGELAATALAAAVRASPAVADSPALFGGITGLAWALRHLRDYAEPEVLGEIDAIDEATARALEAAARALDAAARSVARRPAGDQDPSAGASRDGSEVEFDLISGMVGRGVLALEGLPGAPSRAAAGTILAWLDACAEWPRGPTGWRTPAAALHASAAAGYPDGCVHPGVAHGVAGVLGYVASVHAHGIDNHRAAGLLARGAAWLLARELPGEAALFPLHCAARLRDQAPPPGPPARSAWCTGGPGIAWMLRRAAEAIGDTTLAARARALAIASARRDDEDAGIRDGGLCHGSAGRLLLEARWYAATGEACFREQALRWLRHLDALRAPGTGVAGFSALNAPQRRHEAAPGLLFGAAGIGLALLAALHGGSRPWDSVLLLSSPASVLPLRPASVGHA